MQQSGYPTKFAAIWASSASSGDVTDPIPVSGSSAGRASLQQGFPAQCFQPVGSGGTPPFGADFNGALYMVTAALQAAQAGAAPQFDSTFVTNIGGYPTGCIIASTSVPGLFWISTVDNNMTNPEGVGAANWISFRAGPAVSGLVVLSPSNNPPVEVPAGTYYARVRLIGSGGTGGSGNGGAGGGGGGAGYAEGEQPVTPGASMTATMPAGGVGAGYNAAFGAFSASSGANGSNGASGSVANGGSPGSGSGTGNLRAGQPGAASINLGGGLVLSGAGGASGSGMGAGGQIVGGASGADLNGIAGQSPGGGGSGGIGTGTGGMGGDSLCLVEWLS